MRKPSLRATENQRLTLEIRTIHRDVKERYGSPRMHRELLSRGHVVGRHRVARLMRTARLRARQRRSFVRTTVVSHHLPVAPNRLEQRFDVPRCDHTWVADITYVSTRQGWLYLAVVIDLHSRFVVGWATSPRIDGPLVLKALQMAVARRRPGPGVIVHSDRGTQYASGDYQRYLTRHEMTCSMSRAGNCWDNAVAESFFGMLKAELVNGARYRTRQEAMAAIRSYIELFYNRQRRHSSLGYKAPAVYEMTSEVA
jgi:transposase InsO family protein